MAKAKTNMLPFMPLEAYKEINSLHKLNYLSYNKSYTHMVKGQKNIYTQKDNYKTFFPVGDAEGTCTFLEI